MTLAFGAGLFIGICLGMGVIMITMSFRVERLRAALTKIREVTGTSTEANLIARRALCDEQGASEKPSRSP